MFTANKNSYRSLDDALVGLCKEVIEEGNDVSSALNTTTGMTKEILGKVFIISNPLNRWMINPERKHNVWSQIAESLWILTGNNKVDWLSRFLPRAINYSDDGEIWRAGYHRIINWNDKSKVNQVKYCYETLKSNPLSRQAVISIWDPERECTVDASKDFPCNNWIQFLIRDNKLHMIVQVRSNDLIFGLSGINVVEWTILHELMSSWLDVEVGDYQHQVGSLHIYDIHFERAQSIIGAKFDDINITDIKQMVIPDFNTTFLILDSIFKKEYDLRYYINKKDIQYWYNKLLLMYSEYEQFIQTFTLPLFYNRPQLYSIIKTDSLSPGLKYNVQKYLTNLKN